ncbi:PH domain-containing protein [Streptomyces sp. NPDC056161]|uniref:PH domain-containing protein n=1 Tax=Streptomyces sp. NPDC056161 TaxID=3345732 RepID=UPI0035D6952E
MTTPDHPSSAPQPPVPTAKDRVYRSPAALTGGVLLLALILWLGFDALFTGHGRAPWLALAAMILLVPLVAAFTLRPAVFAGEDRLRVRNPFRVITLPWGEIAGLRSGYSNEVVAESGAKYQLWAIPVSLRARKKAVRRQARAETAARPGGRSGGAGESGTSGRGRTGTVAGAGRGAAFGFGGGRPDGAEPSGPARAETDQIMDYLRETLERRRPEQAAQGEVTVRWAYEVAGPAVAGAVLLAILLAVG